MGKKTSMFELLKERLTEEEIIKITCDYDLKFCELEEENKQLKSQLQQKKNIIKEAREDLYQVVKWCTENKHNEDTIERYLVVDYGTIVGKINEIRTKLDKENK